MSGCGGGMGRVPSSSSGMPQSELEARLVDIPLPVGACVHWVDTDTTSYIFKVSAPVYYDDVISLYTREMDQAGWNTTAMYHGETAYTGVFDKPHKICSVTIEQRQESPSWSSLVISIIYRS